MSDKVVYRSTHPDVIAHMDRHAEAYTAWRERLKDALTELGFDGAAVWMSDDFVVGIVRQRGAELPDGWRWDKKASEPVIVPARKTAEGKRVWRVLDGLKQPDPRNQMPGGMPRRTTAVSEMAFLSCGFRRVGDTAYVTWSAEPDVRRIDAEIWKRIKLSEYYAAIEDAEAVGFDV